MCFKVKDQLTQACEMIKRLDAQILSLEAATKGVVDGDGAKEAEVATIDDQKAATMRLRTIEIMKAGASRYLNTF